MLIFSCKAIRFIGNFNKEEKIKTIDFEELIDYLKLQIPKFGMLYTLLTVDEIFEIVKKKGISFGVLEDAILSRNSAIQFFSGKENEELFVAQNNKGLST